MKNEENILAYDHDDTTVWLGDPGTTGPATFDADPGAGYTDAGWLGDDGVKLLQSTNKRVRRAMQGRRIVKSRFSLEERTITFQMLESTAKRMGLTFPGAVKTTNATTGTVKWAVPAGISPVKQALIADLYDELGGKQRITIPTLTVDPNSTLVYSSEDDSVLEFKGTFSEFDVESNQPAMGATAPGP